MTEEEKDNICMDAVVTYGDDSQIAQTMEECAELTVALHHYQRKRATREEVITEIADVMIMCRQLTVAMFGRVNVAKEEERKLKRLEQRLQADSQNII